MRGEIEFQNPEDIEATLSVTATVHEWRAVAAALRQTSAQYSPAAHQFGALVQELIAKATAHLASAGGESNV